MTEEPSKKRKFNDSVGSVEGDLSLVQEVVIQTVVLETRKNEKETKDSQIRKRQKNTKRLALIKEKQDQAFRISDVCSLTQVLFFNKSRKILSHR
jgi:hypothetical protein